MKNIVKLFLILFIVTGCDNFDKDINKDPNNPSSATASQLIVSAEIALQDVSHNLSGQFLSQYLSEVEYQDASLYPVGSTSFYGWYEGPLMNLNEVLENEKGTNNERAIAKILKAFFFWHVTDRWGDIPFTEALQGTDDLTPVYDTQESIYTALFSLLKEAVTQMDDSDVADDIIYDGDMDQWAKLANTMRLVMALRLSEVDEATGQEEFSSAFNAGVFESNDDSFIFEHLATDTHQNYWYDQIGLKGRQWWALSETLVDHMLPYDDPRLMVYGEKTADDEYVGLVFGTEGVVDASTVSLLGDQLWAQDAPVYVITYAQVLFDLAEGAKRGWIPGGDAEAESYYNMAIENSFDQWTGGTGGYASFISQPDIAYSAANAMEQIGTQRYVHMFMNGYEAWAEWRRTGYPDNLVSPGGKAVPTRQIYVETEQFNNAENYNQAVDRQFGGDDALYGHVWWDQ